VPLVSRHDTGRPGWFEPPNFREQWAGISMASMLFLYLVTLDDLWQRVFSRLNGVNFYFLR
jgi:hypothetical protein